MNPFLQELEALALTQPKFLKKGGLCVGLIITRMAQEQRLPLKIEAMRTAEGGQVTKLGKAAVQKILNAHGIHKVLAEEGGRTSRGSLGLMENYVRLLNQFPELVSTDFCEIEDWWISKVRLHFASEGPKFSLDPGKSVKASLQDLFRQSADIQKNSGGTHYVGAMLQHLVGAKLDLILTKHTLEHHGASVADHSTNRMADFTVNGVAIHITTHPGEAVLRKAAENLKQGLKPLLITMGDGVSGAAYLLKGTDLADRIDVLDAVQFLTANVYERGLLQTAGDQLTIQSIITRYNEIVDACETDPALRIRLA
ncbi:MAG: DUF4928 domain-containing protein [Verrucomicrobiaceae bacterium]|nr:MAG: DUF4928 domain-containing protein [Verrucomicrobiaceae bacterium]